jgi:shikimate kinase
MFEMRPLCCTISVRPKEQFTLPRGVFCYYVGMPLYSITGLSGTGKSTVNVELNARGYESYDGDEDHLAQWYNSDTGALVEVDIEECTPEFLLSHSRDISREIVEGLLPKAHDKPVFLCGAHENEGELQDLFTGVFGLVLDDETLKQRLATRTTNQWGKLPHELEYSLAFRQKWYDNCRRFGYIIIDAAQQTKDIVDYILEEVSM